MRKHWFTAVMMVMLGLLIAAPASAQVICKFEIQLCPSGGCNPLGGPNGVAEVKAQNAQAQNKLLGIKGVSNSANQFDGNVQGLAHEKPFRLAAFNGNTPAQEIAHAFFFTDSNGQADVDIKRALPADGALCNIKSVTVSNFAVTGTGTVVLQGKRGVPNNQVELEPEIKDQIQAEAERELNDINDNNGLPEVELQPNNP